MPKRIRNLSATNRKMLGSEAIGIVHDMISAIHMSMLREDGRRHKERAEKRKLKKESK